MLEKFLDGFMHGLIALALILIGASIIFSKEGLIAVLVIIVAGAIGGVINVLRG